MEVTSKPTQAKANMSLLFVRWNTWVVSKSSGAIHLGEPMRAVNWVTVVSAKLASPKSATLAFHSWSTSMFAYPIKFTTMFTETQVKMAYPSQVAVTYPVRVEMQNTLCNLKQLAQGIKSE
jgi:hypothetical protein